MQLPVSSNEIEALREAREGHYFDRKSARIRPRDLAKTIIALANAAGGKLVVGIEDDGTVTGFEVSGAYPIEEFEQIALFECQPIPKVSSTRVNVVNARGDSDVVLVLDVEASADVVIRRRADDVVFLRQGDKSQRLGDRQIAFLEYDKHQRSFEDEVVEWSNLDDVDHDVLDRYKRALGTDSSDEWVLRSRGFLRNGHLTNAGVLLFASEPTAFLPQARIRVLRYEGTEMGTGLGFNVTKDISFDGPIPKAVDGAATLIRDMLREFQYLNDDGRFEVIPEYPEFAWFEGVVNAVTHRDYAFAGDHIRISMYDDRLEIQSPGRLPNIVTLDNMRETRYSRNPKIARTLVEFGWVRELNEGVKRIYDEMQALFLNAPKFSEPNRAAVKIVLENSITSRVLRRGDSMAAAVGDDVLAALNEYELVAVRCAYVKGRVTVKELCERLGKSVRVSRPVLHGLVGKGILDWHGSGPSDPTQYYSIK